MPKLVPISGKKMTKLLLKLGFVLLRSKGSHYFFFNKESGKTTTLPIHKNEDLSVGLLKKILSDISLSVEEYDKLRKNL